jgi:uncharacterized protein (DUF3084 family)
MKKTKRIIEKDYTDLQTEMAELQKKYISLLEEKGEGFNQFIKYLDLCKEQEIQLKENKKEIADLKSEVKDLTNEVEKINAINLELENQNIDKPKTELEKEIENIVNKKGD